MVAISKIYKKNKQFIPYIVAVVVVLISLIISAFFYFRYKNLAQKAAPQDTKAMVSEVAKHMLLPDETPTLATVTDKNKLQDLPFYKNAENGDRVLIYKNARKAILYRPSISKIVEVSFLDVSPAQSEPTPPAATGSSTLQALVTATPSVTVTQSPARVALYNSTQTNGLTKKAEQDLQKKLPGQNIQVVLRTNSKKDYAKTFVVDLSGGKNKEIVEKVADVFGVHVEPFPQSESKPDSDLLVILGQDYANR